MIFWPKYVHFKYKLKLSGVSEYMKFSFTSQLLGSKMLKSEFQEIVFFIELKCRCLQTGLPT